MRRTGRTLLSPVQNRQEGRVQEHCSQEPEVGVGKQGLCQFCGFRAHAQRNPRAQLSPTLQCCLRAWDMPTPGDETWKNLRLPGRGKAICPKGPRPHILLLPEGLKLRGQGWGVTNPFQTYSPALGAFTPQCPGSHQWVSTGQTWDRKTGTA